MKLLEQRIQAEGLVLEGNILKVDGFLNHQIDAALIKQLAQEFVRLFAGEKIEKVLTVEASGIALACAVAEQLGVHALFAKKTGHKNIAGEVYSAEVLSYTTGKTYEIIVSTRFLKKGERVLIIDDFLARGQALLGLIEILRQADAELVGCGIAIEKGFQDGGRLIRDMGVHHRRSTRKNVKKHSLTV
ncbi:MAG: xanthine phosphoribosyltransferase [Oscillospiraceae bacterium]